MTSRFFAGFHDAGCGLKLLFREEQHFRMQAIIALFLAAMMIFLRLTYAEASFIIIAIILVLGSEAANTVIERIMDSISTKRMRWIGNIKDMMASVVLINSAGALCIGVITLAHYIMRTTGISHMHDWDMAILYRLNVLAGQTALGDSVIIFFASASAWLLILIFVFTTGISRISVQQKISRLIAGGMSGFVARYGLTEAVRFLYPRLRPFMTDHIHQLVGAQSNSFPSGHAATFFALSVTVFYWDKRLGIFFFAISLLMGIARVAAGVHYPSDIIGGMVVGVAGAWIVMRAFGKKIEKL